MRELTDIREIQLIQLDILKYIASLCEENGLNYYLYGGTLLGAIRHKGFIPWDDDLDICMPRSDYKKLIGIMKKRDNDRYSLKCIELSKKQYNYCYAKMIDNNTVLEEVGKFQGDDLGVWVDVFPLDGVGDNIEKAKKIIFNNKKFVKQILCIEAGRKINLKGKIFYYLGRKRLNRLLVHNMKKNNFYKSKYIAVVGDIDSFDVYNGISFQGKRDELFEGIEFSVPYDSEDILKTMYGNYMEMPPEDERKPIHDCRIWIKE